MKDGNETPGRRKKEDNMFNTSEGGTKVKGGFYWHQSEWEMTVVNGAEGTLPGGADAKFVRVPVPVMLIGAPLMGGLLVMFLPLIGIALLAGHAGRNVYRYVRTVASSNINLPVAARGSASNSNEKTSTPRTRGSSLPESRGR
jgi:hypothetical protein